MRLANAAAAILAITLVTACDSGTDPPQEARFAATLAGSAEVPAVTTNATGEATFLHDIDSAELGFELSADDIEDARVAHIHLGEPGENGPIIAFLFTSDEPVTTTSPIVLSSGTIASGDVISVTGFAGTFSALIAEMEAGNTYVNVHTVEHGSGEIRGQIVEVR